MSNKKDAFEKHKMFVDEYLVNGFNATKAYLKFYPDCTEESAATSGHRLLRNEKVIEYKEQRIEEIGLKNLISKEEILLSSLLIRKKAQEDGKYSAANRANEIIAKLLGLDEPTETKLTINDGYDITFGSVDNDDKD